ncbi:MULTISPECIES: L-histidine N(alpha)-methyltransferase [Streptomyces]|uniref:L-histidine N(alpha)-methyltransferase n=1 Tax=Streptomyces TaxID=1883 RepID=UPI00068D171A|nr:MULTISPECIES: L-histidine N(alpha)-methyltransferase [Streptomyces]MDX3275265.1 L-histidine N(alpha)-methyltransferase [Streptomyces scabiei]MDX3846969.1 L-histidine N(alpha)-methyltransferase [Streptomyces europaeiscabiei]
MTAPALPAVTSPAPDHLAELRTDVVRGFATSPKQLSPKWLYDADGSQLFDEITRLPEYYPFRTEQAIIADSCTTIAWLTCARTLIELGSGSCSAKTRLLLDALSGPLTSYVPVDVSSSALAQASASIAAEYPGLTVKPLLADFTAAVDLPPTDGPRLFAFLGGTFGNFLPPEQAAFLATLTSRLAPGDRLLLGVDLVKDPAVIIRAYNDAAGVTARFNLGLLHRLNRELDADFDVAAFEHVAVWDADHEWIEMRLRSRRDQTVTLRGVDLVVPFAAGEELRTEVSAKFHPHGLAAQLNAAGLELSHWWTDPARLYGLAMIARADDITPAA